MAVAVSKDRGYRFVGLVGLSDSPDLIPGNPLGN